ncbi:beta-ureidopropionase [Patescibacteria group bacterium]|nr:beta-ureidopropionase [Patescibacteria group bacterium]
MAFLIALAQFNPMRRNVTTNIRKIQRLLKAIKADLVVLPELANCGYLYDSKDELFPFSESQDGRGIFLSSLTDLATETGGVIVAGYAERENDVLYNSAAAVTTEGVLVNYRKIHLYAGEKFLFQPGDSGFTTFTWCKIKIGIMICFDWIFPESARTLALAGAQIIAHPANLVLPYCQDAMVTRSIENGVFTITANRIGKEKSESNELTFTGASQMTNPQGKILFRGPKNRPTVHIMEIDPQEALDKQISANNHLIVDRRPEHYHL